ncbi:unnamed protein product [Owenia fusiformis]|uniref:Aminotransferase class I/classII large domain-containing protein n=1 Tax=Owenia fusiformis TaxID=6347 RepID=A0A8J1U1W9_OWEFU|nr:unnamed protein product [Owenia fusiformis]
MLTALSRALAKVHIEYAVAALNCQTRNMSTDASSKFALADRLKGSGGNVWVEFGKLATDYKATNLGQGFPDFSAPEYVKEALCDAVNSPNVFMNQYTRSYGHPRLVNALAKTFSPMYGREIDPMTETCVTVGAYGSLYAAIQGLVNPGDEVIIIEPFFDCYEPMVRCAGGTPVFVPLKPTKTEGTVTSADWKYDLEELSSKFNEKTKLIILNTPHNPVGKIFTRSELEEISALCKKHNVVVISDEVYEWLVYSGAEHIKIATLPGMWERTITIGSAGKTFNVTGWKLGWSIGPSHLIQCLTTVHQNCNYTCPTPIQEAVAVGFETELPRINTKECFYHSLPAELQVKRDRLAELLKSVGMTPTIPEGGYFMMADISQLDFKVDESNPEPKDYQFVKWMTREKKLSAIPPSAFYSQGHKFLAENTIRWCFIKKDETLDKVEEIFKEWNK